MTKQLTVKFDDSLKKLTKALEGVAPRLENQVNEAVKTVAYEVHAEMKAMAHAKLNSSRQDYHLEFEDLGNNNFLIYIDGDLGNQLESGWSAFSMLEKMLASSATVKRGERKGQPWVQETKPRGEKKETHKYAHVPFEQKPFSKAGGATMADAIKGVKAENTKGNLQSITKVFKDALGNPMQGKVATVDPSTVSDPRLKGMVKYQTVEQAASGKQTVRSLYMTYRTISEKGSKTGASWQHPGFEGVKAFDEAERLIAEKFDQIIKKLL